MQGTPVQATDGTGGTRRRSSAKLQRRIIEAAEAALEERRYVSVIDILVGLGWLHPANVDRWSRGRVDYLERVIQVDPGRVSVAVNLLQDWARHRGLQPSEIGYPAGTRDRRPLRFSSSEDADIERAYRTHWFSPQLSENDRQQLAERQGGPSDLVVISPLKEWTCTECGGGGDLLLMEGPGPICMSCADLDHLLFLPSGEAALTRRAKKHSDLRAVVVRFSRSRKRYERQGILVEGEAIERAEAECLADADVRARRREREAERRVKQDTELQAQMAQEIARLFPGCPTERAEEIARHTAARGSGRVGRSAAGRSLEPGAIELAVAASVRHLDTGYDELLMAGMNRHEARERVAADAERVLATWRTPARSRKQSAATP